MIKKKTIKLAKTTKTKKLVRKKSDFVSKIKITHYSKPKKIIFEKERRLPVRSNYSYWKITATAALVLALALGVSSVESTVSYFNDIETSINNKLQAGVLNFNIFSDNDLNTFSAARIASTEEAIEESSQEAEGDVGEKEFNITIDNEDSLPASYTVSGNLDIENPLGCEKLNIEASLGKYNYNGLFTEFKTERIEEIGEWNFKITLPHDTELLSEAICKGEVVFNAGLADVAEELAHTFSDEKEYHFEIKNWRDVVVEPTVIEAGEIIETLESFDEAQDDSTESEEEVVEEEVVETEEEPLDETEDDSTESKEEEVVEEETTPEPEAAEEELSETEEEEEVVEDDSTESETEDAEPVEAEEAPAE